MARRELFRSEWVGWMGVTELVLGGPGVCAWVSRWFELTGVVLVRVEFVTTEGTEDTEGGEGGGLPWITEHQRGEDVEVGISEW